MGADVYTVMLYCTEMFVLYCMAMFGKIRELVNVLLAFPGATATLTAEGQGRGRGGKRGEEGGGNNKKAREKGGRVTDGSGRRLIGCRNALCSL